jgi:uncharacterized protein (DUF1015 family)
MATLHPFRALRPRPDAAEAVASVPYDVVSVEEARRLAEGNDKSFLHVIRPEIDLPEGTDEHADEVYEQGAENLRRFAESGFMQTEDAPALYVYRLVMNGRAQTGLFGCVAVGEYDDGTILKHEETRPAKEDDRTRHILTQRAHAEPVMLTHRGDAEVERLTEEATQTEPLYDFEAETELAGTVRHTIWRAPDAEALSDAFGAVPQLYVADGHHRCKAASRAAAELRENEGTGTSEFAFFPAVLFPMDQMRILPYNRVVYDLPDGPDAFLEKLGEQVGVEENTGQEAPETAGVVCCYLGGDDGGRWHRLALPETERSGRADQLDVARLSEFVFEPLLGITDPRRDANLDFVGGIRGTGELEERVDKGQAEAAFSMYPTQIEDLLDVSDAGELMPPKSTWFEPKLRSGLLAHQFG